MRPSCSAGPIGPAEERGSASLFAVAVVGLLLVVGAALGVVAALVHAHRQAQAAADLAALAGGQALARGGDACAVVAAVAAANGASVVVCTPSGWEVRVAVEVRGPRWLGQTHDLGAQARAGPAEPLGLPG